MLHSFCMYVNINNVSTRLSQQHTPAELTHSTSRLRLCKHTHWEWALTLIHLEWVFLGLISYLPLRLGFNHPPFSYTYLHTQGQLRLLLSIFQRLCTHKLIHRHKSQTHTHSHTHKRYTSLTMCIEAVEMALSVVRYAVLCCTIMPFSCITVWPSPDSVLCCFILDLPH